MEGGLDLDDDITPETPLQLASAAGKVDIVELLLSFGASPFLSTLKVDTMSFGSSAQKGCYCALSTAASHGQRKVLHKLGRVGVALSASDLTLFTSSHSPHNTDKSELGQGGALPGGDPGGGRLGSQQ